MKPTLYIIGTPLSESKPLSKEAVEILQTCPFIIGESKPVLDRYLKGHDAKGERFHLDPPRPDEKAFILEALDKCKKENQSVALLSDVGLPILFDPGDYVLEHCKKLGFQIRSVPGPVSWATACAVSGWGPPFLVYGFLGRESGERARELARIKKSDAHTVLMETPYRFKKLLKELVEALEPKRPVFLAWEIGKAEEDYYWGPLTDLTRYAESRGMEKGEFVLLIKGLSSVK